jgi:hypothetical protein
VSATLGFASFLAYLGYGYLDAWHGAATLLLLPTFVVGLMASDLTPPHARDRGFARHKRGLPIAAAIGRWGLLATGIGITAAGGVIIFSV